MPASCARASALKATSSDGKQQVGQALTVLEIFHLLLSFVKTHRTRLHSSISRGCSTGRSATSCSPTVAYNRRRSRDQCPFRKPNIMFLARDRFSYSSSEQIHKACLHPLSIPPNRFPRYRTDKRLKTILYCLLQIQIPK